MNKISLKQRRKKSSKKKSPNKHFRQSPTLQDIDDIFLGQTVSASTDKSLNSNDTSKYKQTITVSPNTKTINIKKFNNTQFINSKSYQSNNIVSTSISNIQNVKSIDNNIKNTNITTDNTIIKNTNITNKDIIKSSIQNNSNNDIRNNKDTKIKSSEYTSNRFNQNKIYEYYPVKKYSHNNKLEINLNNCHTKKHKIKKDVKLENHIQKINNNDNDNDNKNYKKILPKDEITIQKYNKALKDTENIYKNNNLSRKIRLYTNLDNFKNITHIFTPYVYNKFKDNLKYYNNLTDFADKYILSIITDGIIIK